MNILKILTEKRLKGNLGERAAAKYLKKKGYKILERNLVAGGNEIDIVAFDKKRNTVVFTEVKARSIQGIGSFESRPAASVTPEKQRKIISASTRFMSRMGQNTRMRYDVIEVYLENTKGKDKVGEIKHLISAFDFNTAYDKQFTRK